LSCLALLFFFRIEFDGTSSRYLRLSTELRSGQKAFHKFAQGKRS
jgi:hypothetical protein